MDKKNHSNQLAAESVYQAVFEVLDDAVMVLDAGHQLVYLNPSAMRLLGATADQLQGQRIEDVFLKQYQVNLSLDNPPDTPIAIQPDGKTRYFAVEVKPLADSGWQIVILDDVTGQQEALANVEHLLASYSDYAHTVGHDVKAPLGVAIGYSNMLQSELEDGTEARFFADEIFNMSMRIIYICNELVLLGEMRTLNHIEQTTVNLRMILDQVTRRFSRELLDQNITLNEPKILPTIRANPLWIEEVIVNFIRHAMLQDGTTVIDVDTLEKDGNIHFRVQHNGQPLSPQEQATLLNNNFKLEDIRAEGFGLGLDVSSYIIRRLGGEIGIEGGQTLYFVMPADEAL